jgi:SAM-dependent methyltransferase
MISSIDLTATSILGELLWHSVTVDPSIVPISDEHFSNITRAIGEFLPEFGRQARRGRFLEVAAYAHITGYRIAAEYRADVTVTDISVETLALGKNVAAQQGLGASDVSRVACDFHDLPFEDDQFDLVYMASALHHTWSWQTVVRELMRVLAPRGLLYLQNEPLHRALALYKFRTNRAEAMRPFEKALADQGVLRTVADPIPGSRPEILFGMIENQTIPLAGLKSELTKDGSIVRLEARTAEMIGELERELLRRRREPVALIAGFLAGELSRRLDAVRPFFSATDAALGCAMPSRLEIEGLARDVAERLSRLPDEEKSAPCREGVAAIFGAALECVVRKNGSFAETRAKPLRFSWGRRSDVTIAYPTAINALLESAVDVLPDVQTSSEQTLFRTFPETEWVADIHGERVRVLIPRAPKSTIRCSAVARGSLVRILIRSHVVHGGENWRLRASYQGATVAEMPVYQTDSALLSFSFTALDESPVIVLERLRIDDERAADNTTFVIAALRACAFSRP